MIALAAIILWLFSISGTSTMILLSENGDIRLLASIANLIVWVLSVFLLGSQLFPQLNWGLVLLSSIVVGTVFMIGNIIVVVLIGRAMDRTPIK